MGCSAPSRLHRSSRFISSVGCAHGPRRPSAGCVQGELPSCPAWFQHDAPDSLAGARHQGIAPSPLLQCSLCLLGSPLRWHSCRTRELSSCPPSLWKIHLMPLWMCQLPDSCSACTSPFLHTPPSNSLLFFPCSNRCSGQMTKTMTRKRPASREAAASCPVGP